MSWRERLLGHHAMIARLGTNPRRPPPHTLQMKIYRLETFYPLTNVVNKSPQGDKSIRHSGRWNIEFLRT